MLMLEMMTMTTDGDDVGHAVHARAPAASPRATAHLLDGGALRLKLAGVIVVDLLKGLAAVGKVAGVDADLCSRQGVQMRAGVSSAIGKGAWRGWGQVAGLGRGGTECSNVMYGVLWALSWQEKRVRPLISQA